MTGLELLNELLEIDKDKLSKMDVKFILQEWDYGPIAAKVGAKPDEAHEFLCTETLIDKETINILGVESKDFIP